MKNYLNALRRKAGIEVLLSLHKKDSMYRDMNDAGASECTIRKRVSELSEKGFIDSYPKFDKDELPVKMFKLTDRGKRVAEWLESAPNVSKEDRDIEKKEVEEPPT